MLTKQLAIAKYDFQKGQIYPDRLTQSAHKHYVRYAQQMLRIYRQGSGRTRRELHRDVHAVLAVEPECPTRRINAFCKLLDDVSVFHKQARRGASALRKQVFQLAASRHPLVSRADRLFETDEWTVKTDISRQLGRPWRQIERDLLADVTEFHRLEQFDGYPNPRSLLARYNVAQIQVALYGAIHATVWAPDDFKTILRYAKLARLMHSIWRDGEGAYRIRLDGPASVLRGTRRYGVAMAKFFPALVACRNWRMHAVVCSRHRGWKLSLDVSSRDGLNSHLPSSSEFDSQVEQTFARSWGTDRREGWLLERESEIVHLGQKVFLPDFVFRHEDGRTVLMEIIGFWTPEYLSKKIATLQTFKQHSILLAIAEPLRDRLPASLDNVITFKSNLQVEKVLQCLTRRSGICLK